VNGRGNVKAQTADRTRTHSREELAVMHPHQLGPLATQHIADLHEASRTRRQASGSAAGRPRNSVRHRAGWVLVHLGLRLAVSSADA